MREQRSEVVRLHCRLGLALEADIGLAAVERDGLAREPRAEVAREEQRQVGDVGRQAPPAYWVSLDQPAEALLLDLGRTLQLVDRPQRDGVGRDAVPGDLAGDAARQSGC